MRYARRVPGQGPRHRLVEEFDADLVPQVPTTPPIMVAAHEGDWNTRGHDHPKPFQERLVPTGDPPLVFEPEIEEISIDQDRRRAGRGVVEPLEKRLLVSRRTCSEMDIGGDVDGLRRRHGTK